MNLFFSIVKIVAGIVFFLFAIRLFSSVLKNKLHNKISPIFRKIGENRFAGVAIGAGATAAMQSSSATTAITVGLVNAGIVNLFMASAIIMGANVGTTLTSLFVALSSLPIKYGFMALLPLGLILFIFRKTKTAGQILIALGGIFIALELISLGFSQNETLLGFFRGLFSTVRFPLLLILLGMVFTAIIQSSSATMAIYMSMIASGVLPFYSAIFLLFGSEIGTCLTTLLASLRGNKMAKRAALIHLLFNLFSAILFTLIFWPLGGLIIPWYLSLISSPYWQLAIFQVFYNVITVSILIWFIKPINKLVGVMIK